MSNNQYLNEKSQISCLYEKTLKSENHLTDHHFESG